MVKIVIVDDEPLVLVTLRAIIEGIDGAYQVAGEFSNGKDTMDYISIHSDVDIVITDVDMPVMDGLSLAEMLSGRPQSVLFLSAYSSFNYARSAYRLGAEDYVLKSEMDAHRVRATLDAIVEKRRNAGLTNDQHTRDSSMLTATKFLRMASLGDANAEELAAAFDECGFKVQFPLCFMVLHPSDAGHQVKDKEAFMRQCLSLLRLAAPFGSVIDAAAVDYGEYCVISSGTAILDEVFTSFNTSAQSYLDVSFERKDGSTVENAQEFAAAYKNAVSSFLPTSRPVVRAKRYIHEHFADNTIGLKDIAKYAEVSSGYMSTIFKQETGENVLDFLARVRVDRASKLLHETNLLVAEVAERTGFANVETFSRVFKKVTKMSPSAARTNGIGHIF